YVRRRAQAEILASALHQLFALARVEGKVMSIQISVQCADIASIPADLLLLKHAQNFYGADQAIVSRLTEHGICRESDICPPDGDHLLPDPGTAIAATQTLFLGTPRLRNFRYREMKQFARRTIEIIHEERLPVHTLTTTVHGAGIGLDVAEAFRSLIF